ncbi:hypothetical protein K7957_09865 [Sphingomonas yunnanensis]|uniref:hypothetical protein n=1 Tax=Sphingomonas yunnanensis TaxID=310400 RepID=UPI001CA7488C|nr:hypothetical protein [Sphingomonas yunnanensis]MBY9063237.1 hypothetical protein [Sphingomonas yunnanensis]
MRRRLITATVLALPLAAAPALAQYGNGSGLVLDTPASAPVFTPAQEFPNSSATPTMRRQRLAAAAALRTEVAQMVADGKGQLTDEQVAYVRQRVRRINGARD